MTTSSGIRVRILGDDSDLQNKLRNSTTAIAKWGAAAGLAAAAGGAALVRSGLASADAQVKLSRQLNTTIGSLQRTTRAADMAGVSTSQLESATRNLNDRLGQAISQGGPAADALEKIGLSAEYVASLPLDERITAINEALINNVSAAERASVASDIYGRRAGQAMAQITPDTIEEATRQLDRFGGTLSDLDARQIEAANDAISQSQVAFQSVTQQLAAQFAPVLSGLVGEMEKLTDETDFFDTAAQRTFSTVMRAAGFTADAIEGVRRVFLLAGQASATFALQTVKMMTEATESIMGGPVRAVNALIEQMNRIPRVEIPTFDQPEFVQGMQRDIDMLEGAVAEGMAAMQRTMMEPMPSENIEAWVETVQDASERAARAAAEVGAAMAIPSLADDNEESSEAEEKELEKLQARLADRMEIIRRSLMDEREMEVTEHWDRINEIDEALDAGVISLEKHQRMERELSEQHQARLTAIDKAGTQARVDMLSDGLGNMASLMDSENRKLFEIGKAAAIGQAVVDGISATVSSYKEGAKLGGPIVGAAFAATAAAATGMQVAKLSSQSYGGGGSVSAPPSSAPTVPEQAQQGGGQTQQSVNLNLSLVGDSFSRSQVMGLGRDMVDEINNALDDGAQLRVTGT